MAVEGVLEQPAELRIVPALLDVAGDGVTHDARHRAALDLGQRLQPRRQLRIEPQEDVLRLCRDIRISRCDYFLRSRFHQGAF